MEEAAWYGQSCEDGKAIKMVQIILASFNNIVSVLRLNYFRFLLLTKVSNFWAQVLSLHLAYSSLKSVRRTRHVPAQSLFVNESYSGPLTTGIMSAL